MTTVAEIVRAAWPGADADTIDFVLWNRTAYPFECSARRIYRAARTACRAAAHSIRLCDFCSERAAPGNWVCAQHVALYVALERASFQEGQWHGPSPSADWTLAAWRASNAAQTMAAMTGNPALDGFARSMVEAEKLAESVAGMPESAVGDAVVRDRLAQEAAFYYFKVKGWPIRSVTNRIGETYRDAYREGWDAARANQDGEVKA